MTQVAFLPVFCSPYEQVRNLNGREFTVLGKVSHETHPHLFDPEVGYLWHVRFADGSETFAWPEEVQR
jgi:hypothetical protein